MYDASKGGDEHGRPITDGDFAINAVLRVVINVRGRARKIEGIIRAPHSSNRKIQDPIYPAEVRYEAITGHVAQ